MLVLQNQYLPDAYQVSMVILPEKPNFSGTWTCQLRKNPNFSGSSGQPAVTLHAHKLVITTATFDDSTPCAIKYDRSAQTVTFTPKESVDFEPSKLSLVYMGQLNAIKTYHDKTYGLFKTNYSDVISGKSNNHVVATHTQPFGARLIFPVVDELAHKVPIELTIETNSKYSVISTAAQISKEIKSMSENSVFKFKPTPPMATSVFGFVVGDLESISDGIVSVYTPKGESKYGTYALTTASKLLPVLEGFFGIKYPLDKLDIVALPFLSDMAMENWGMISIISSQLLIDETSVDELTKKNLRQLIAHELVHQWIGNLVTFDDWSQLWLNESFATWVGDYILYVAQLNPLDTTHYELEQASFFDSYMKSDIDMSISLLMLKLDVGSSATTLSLFDKHSYEKGMVLLRMVASVIQLNSLQGQSIDKPDYTKMGLKLGEFMKNHQHRSFKSFEIWQALSECTSIDLPSFARSWISYGGYPVVKVSEENDCLTIEQNKFTSVEDENSPYHVPLLLKILDEEGNLKVLNILMTDRSTKLDIPVKNLVCVNHSKCGYYRVDYDESLTTSLLQKIEQNHLSSTDLISIVNDLWELLNSHVSNSHHLKQLLQIIDVFSRKKWVVDFKVLKVSLNILEKVNHILMHFSDYEFETWLSSFTDRIYNKIGNWDSLHELSLNQTYSPVEYEVRNMVLILGYTKSEMGKVATTLFKNFMNAGIHKKFIPKEIIPAMFNLTMYKSNQKDYKAVLQFVKNANVSNLKVTNVSAQELQTLAISSLSFCESELLLHKTLNFVKDNIDSQMIELGLIGFKFKSNKSAKQQLWNWYKVNYDQFIIKSLRKGSDWAKQIGVAVDNITKIVIGEIMQYDKRTIEFFLQEKAEKFPNHHLKQLIEEIDKNNLINWRIGSYSPCVKSISL